MSTGSIAALYSRTMAGDRCVRALISGRVQGVFYRDSTRREATRAGLSGWVRNLADGRVEAVFSGPADAVAAMLEWCRQGPPLARVDGVAVDELEAASDLAGFAVRPTAAEPAAAP